MSTMSCTHEYDVAMERGERREKEKRNAKWGIWNWMQYHSRCRKKGNSFLSVYWISNLSTEFLKKYLRNVSKNAPRSCAPLRFSSLRCLRAIDRTIEFHETDRLSSHVVLYQFRTFFFCLVIVCILCRLYWQLPCACACSLKELAWHDVENSAKIIMTNMSVDWIFCAQLTKNICLPRLEMES